jgi:hypothetical protein
MRPTKVLVAKLDHNLLGVDMGINAICRVAISLIGLLSLASLITRNQVSHSEWVKFEFQSMPDMSTVQKLMVYWETPVCSILRDYDEKVQTATIIARVRPRNLRGSHCYWRRGFLWNLRSSNRWHPNVLRMLRGLRWTTSVLVGRYWRTFGRISLAFEDSYATVGPDRRIPIHIYWVHAIRWISGGDTEQCDGSEVGIWNPDRNNVRRGVGRRYRSEDIDSNVEIPPIQVIGSLKNAINFQENPKDCPAWKFNSKVKDTLVQSRRFNEDQTHNSLLRTKRRHTARRRMQFFNSLAGRHSPFRESRSLSSGEGCPVIEPPTEPAASLSRPS